jgi:hypothetical protein
MKEIGFIIALHRSIRIYEAEKRKPFSDDAYFYNKFLKVTTAIDLVEHVLTAACMYPRSISHCQDLVKDLSYGVNTVGEFDVGRLNVRESELVAELVQDFGKEVIDQLDAHGYYDPDDSPHRDDDDYLTNLTGIAEVEELRKGVFRVRVKFYNDDGDYAPRPRSPYTYYNNTVH